MTVQQLIDTLNTIEDKQAVVLIRDSDCDGDVFLRQTREVKSYQMYMHSLDGNYSYIDLHSIIRPRAAIKINTIQII